ncbi:DUF1629 domain-containing protein [Corallococcus sp. CA053C]|uniref:imm11 family protein n=1 Tax=Corallococcus sp. CA053C TaxID=2316732 RepID=UPI0011C41B27|nr:DUF1629 domain-containing protein [Corallococcus sp. CA053C]
MPYYVMVCEGKHPIMPIRKGPRKGGWRLGRLITDPVAQPLVYELDSNYPGSPKAMYSAESAPLMHDSVRMALTSAGVSNIQYFDAVLKDPASGKELLDYKAFNIVGLVACADMGASEVMGTSDSAMGDADFHALVIDETKAGGQLLFRLAENISAIVVHDRIKQAIEAAGIPGFVFYGPGEWSG